MSPDPSGLAYSDPGNPQSLNLYSYVLNNPLTNVDPSGMECMWDDGSYDSADDPDSGGTSGGTKCASLGGTWIDPDLFEGIEGNQRGSWSGKANSSIAFDWLTPGSITTGSASDLPLSSTFSLSGISSGELISELEGVGFAPHTLDDLLGVTGGGHTGRNLRDSNAACSIHITIDPGSGQYGKPVTGSWHIDEFNPFTFPSSYPLEGFLLHATQDVIPDIIHDKNIDRSVIPGNRTCPHHGGD